MTISYQLVTLQVLATTLHNTIALNTATNPKVETFITFSRGTLWWLWVHGFSAQPILSFLWSTICISHPSSLSSSLWIIIWKRMVKGWLQEPQSPKGGRGSPWLGCLKPSPVNICYHQHHHEHPYHPHEADNENTGSVNLRELRLPVQQSHIPGLRHLL